MYSQKRFLSIRLHTGCDKGQTLRKQGAQSYGSSTQGDDRQAAEQDTRCRHAFFQAGDLMFRQFENRTNTVLLMFVKQRYI